MWKTLEKFTHTWVYDNHGFVQTVSLQHCLARGYRLKLTREANVIGCHLLPLNHDVVPTGALAKLNERPFAYVLRVLEGGGYGADLRDFAANLDLRYDDPCPGQPLGEVVEPQDDD